MEFIFLASLVKFETSLLTLEQNLQRDYVKPIFVEKLLQKKIVKKFAETRGILVMYCIPRKLHMSTDTIFSNNQM
jgi:hypothetical protein